MKICSDLFSFSPTFQEKLESKRQSQAVTFATKTCSWSVAQGGIPEEIFAVVLIVTRIWKPPNAHVR